jgi:hypothetical protein
VLFQDEFSLSNTATLSATWATRGKQPVIDCKQAEKERLTGFGSVNPLTGQLVAGFCTDGKCRRVQEPFEKGVAGV